MVEGLSAPYPPPHNESLNSIILNLPRAIYFLSWLVNHRLLLAPSFSCYDCRGILQSGVRDPGIAMPEDHLPQRE